MNKVRKTIDIPDKEFKKLSLLALENGLSFKKYVEELLSETLKEKENFKIIKVN